MHSATVTTRMPVSFAAYRAGLLALDSNQVQQATEDLISARDRLSAEAQGTPGAQGKNSTSSATKPATKSATKPATKSAAKSPANSPANSAGKPSAQPATSPAVARKQSSTPVTARQTSGTDAEQTAGAETK